MCLYCQHFEDIQIGLTEMNVMAIARKSGGRYEQAFLCVPRQFDACIRLDKFLDALQLHYPETNIRLQVIRGRNKIRRLRGLEEMNY